MDLMKEPQEQAKISVDAKQVRDKLRELVNELKDGTVLSVDLSEVITDGQEDG